MSKILITGGAGFIGLNVAVEFLKNNHEIVIVDDLKNSYISHFNSLKKEFKNTLNFYKGNVCNTSFMDKVFKETKPEVVIHLAAKKYVAESIVKPKEYMQNNLNSLTTVLQLCKKHKIKKFAFSSTSVVYENLVNHSFVETDPTKGLNPYALSKCEGEKIIKNWFNETEISTIIFRFTNPVGSNLEYMLGDHSKKKKIQLIPYVVNSAINNNKITLRGNTYNTPDGTPIRSFIHITDLAKSVYVAVNNFNGKLEVFNIGNENLELSTKQIVLATEKEIGHPINYDFTAANNQENAKVSCNCDKFKQTFNYKNQFSINDIINSQINFDKEINKK